MIKKIIPLLFLISIGLNLNAQNDSTQLIWNEINNLKYGNKMLQKYHSDLQLKISTQQKELNELKLKVTLKDASKHANRLVMFRKHQTVKVIYCGFKLR